MGSLSLRAVREFCAIISAPVEEVLLNERLQASNGVYSHIYGEAARIVVIIRQFGLEMQLYPLFIEAVFTEHQLCARLFC